MASPDYGNITPAEVFFLNHGRPPTAALEMHQLLLPLVADNSDLLALINDFIGQKYNNEHLAQLFDNCHGLLLHYARERGLPDIEPITHTRIVEHGKDRIEVSHTIDPIGDFLRDIFQGLYYNQRVQTD
jgi:hypothetical protein